MARKKLETRKPTPRKPVASKKKTEAKKRAATSVVKARRGRGSADFTVTEPSAGRGLGQDAAGQSGDTEGLSRAASAASESVEELLEEGQAFEAGIISGVENAPDADEAEVTTREVPEDDVPKEYLDQD
jgi:hypothetical protein